MNSDLIVVMHHVITPNSKDKYISTFLANMLTSFAAGLVRVFY